MHVFSNLVIKLQKITVRVFYFYLHTVRMGTFVQQEIKQRHRDIISLSPTVPLGQCST
jgi:hypothetical protein